ncbi:formin-like protein 16 [Macadamia integrifolia]|uniref:formin-like protein 16 n=1 Tax=Macadamia integrifolia TaxID=60698 RepID=UPI001C4EEE2F|nr:formin-like protein 16 [Macadamia integrifolia]
MVSLITPCNIPHLPPGRPAADISINLRAPLTSETDASVSSEDFPTTFVATSAQASSTVAFTSAQALVAEGLPTTPATTSAQASSTVAYTFAQALAATSEQALMGATPTAARMPLRVLADQPVAPSATGHVASANAINNGSPLLPTVAIVALLATTVAHPRNVSVPAPPNAGTILPYPLAPSPLPPPLKSRPTPPLNLLPPCKSLTP